MTRVQLPGLVSNESCPSLFSVSTLARGQYPAGLQGGPEPGPCRLPPDRRRCAPSPVPRWYYNPVKVETPNVLHLLETMSQTRMRLQT